MVTNLRPRLALVWRRTVFGQALSNDVAVPIPERHVIDIGNHVVPKILDVLNFLVRR